MLSIVQFYCKTSLSVYGRYFFISLVESSLETGLNGIECQKKQIENLFFIHRVLPSKHLKISVPVVSKPNKAGIWRCEVKSRKRSKELEFVFCHSNRHPSS